MKSKFLAYGGLLGGLILSALIAHSGHTLFEFFHHSSEGHLIVTFFVISMIFAISFGVFHLSNKTVLPSFVVAIFFGLVAKPLLEPIIVEKELLAVLVGLGATLILFGGGLETPFANFRKLFWKIASLSFPGLFLTAFLFSLTVYGISSLFGVNITIPVAILLGAVLASTDPAAIIPILKQLRFKNRYTKDVIVSESAVTDVTGTLLTVAFLGILTAGGVFTGIVSGYKNLFSAEAGFLLLKQIVFGVVFGVLGYLLLVALVRFKEQHEEEYEADAAFFLFVPVIIFTFALAFGGSGYLAAFVAGLLFTLTKHLHRTEGFFNHTIEGFLKPMIFMLLGALVDVQSLIDYAGVGLLAALVFMFVIRPLAVFVTLGPFSFFGKDQFSARELLFISFVRETGAIPAVLLVTVVSLGLPGMDGLVPVGMWVILATLIVEPALTPLLAQKLKVAEVIKDEKALRLHEGGEPFVVLGSRGTSFIGRLPRVTEWATKHSIARVVLLHCLENDYTPHRAEEIRETAETEFKKLNDNREKAGEKTVEFSYVSRKGFLQDNIRSLAEEQQNVTAIFVGKKMLEFRLEEIKDLNVPLFFLD